MTEEEYEAELAKQEGMKASNVKESEEDILSPEEVAAMKAKIENYAPWMNVDPEAPDRRPIAASAAPRLRASPPCAGHRTREESARGPQESGAHPGRWDAA